MCIGESGEARRAGARPQGALDLGVTPPGGRTGSGLLGDLYSWTMVARLPSGTLLLLESGPAESRFLVLSPYLGDARGHLSASYHGGPGLASPSSLQQIQQSYASGMTCGRAGALKIAKSKHSGARGVRRRSPQLSSIAQLYSSHCRSPLLTGSQQYVFRLSPYNFHCQ